MTREEKEKAIEIIRKYECNAEHYEACEAIIKALEQKLVLDKIGAEIEQQRKEASNKHSEDAELQAYYDGLNDGLKDARDIIDKYRVESEV